MYDLIVLSVRNGIINSMCLASRRLLQVSHQLLQRLNICSNGSTSSIELFVIAVRIQEADRKVIP